MFIEKAAKILDETPNYGNKNLSTGLLDTNIWEAQKMLMKLFTAAVCDDFPEPWSQVVMPLFKALLWWSRLQYGLQATT